MNNSLCSELYNLIIIINSFLNLIKDNILNYILFRTTGDNSEFENNDHRIWLKDSVYFKQWGCEFWFLLLNVAKVIKTKKMKIIQSNAKDFDTLYSFAAAILSGFLDVWNQNMSKVDMLTDQQIVNFHRLILYRQVIWALKEK